MLAPVSNNDEQEKVGGEIWESSSVYLLKLGASEKPMKRKEKIQASRKNRLCDFTPEKNKVA